RAAEAAAGLRAEADAFLSEPDGPLARALHGYPAAQREFADRIAARAEERGRAFVANAESLLAAFSGARAEQARLTDLQTTYAEALPSTWADLGLASQASRLGDATSPATVERFAAELRETEALLE